MTDGSNAFRVISAAILAPLLGWVTMPAQAQQVTPEEFQTQVALAIEPFAELAFTDDNLLKLELPPAASTAPSAGVGFEVVGNASAILTAEPDVFVEVSGQHYGAALLNGNPIGYGLDLRFPRQGVAGSPNQFAGLPGYKEGPTEPPLQVDLTLTGGVRTGVLHMESSPDWTPDGNLPAPGTYVGSVTLTLTATN